MDIHDVFEKQFDYGDILAGRDEAEKTMEKIIRFMDKTESLKGKMIKELR